MNSSLQHILTGRLRKKELVIFLQKQPKLFSDVIQIALGDKEPESWRAAWLAKNYMSQNDERLKPYITQILKAIPNKKDGHQRELLKILMEMKLTKKQEGILFDSCMTIWEKINKSSSVRGIALTFLAFTIKKYPDLISEIDFLTQNHYLETLTPGIRNSVARIIKEINLT